MASTLLTELFVYELTTIIQQSMFQKLCCWLVSNLFSIVVYVIEISARRKLVSKRRNKKIKVYTNPIVRATNTNDTQCLRRNLNHNGKLEKQNSISTGSRQKIIVTHIAFDLKVKKKLRIPPAETV